MYDYGLSTLEQYGILVPEGTYRIRGAVICRTEQGVLILKEFHGSEKKLLAQQELLKKLERQGFFVDSYLENKEGSLISRDRDGIAFTLQHWKEGRECDTKSEEDLKKSVMHLAQMHQTMQLPYMELYQQRSLVDEYRRHNQELKKIYRYIQKKGTRNVFEREYLAQAGYFIKKGEEALECLLESSYDKLRDRAKEEGCVCHGEYHQHNVWFSDNQIFAVNFEKWNFDIQISDLYRFMRKILEKNNWDVPLAKTMLKVYHQTNPITREAWENLYIRFLYPEKYWKLADYYYSHKKVWISDKQVEKLRNVMNQREKWERFTQQCFAEYPF